MTLILACFVFLVLCAMTFIPAMRVLYGKNPAFLGMLFTLSACFLGVYAALEFSRSEDRLDRMARAATMMEMTKEALTTTRMEARILSKLNGQPSLQTEGATLSSASGIAVEAKPVSGSPKELGELLNNLAILEQISPQSLKALLACQVSLEKELQLLSSTKGRARRHHLNGYLRELAFAQGVLTAEVEFQRGNIGRSDLAEILQDWTLKKSLPRS